ncbi:MAG: peptidase family protein [Parcubacteria group bacterium]|nr:peptidase family protein [Parcubacteria group bacterium]
MPKAALKRTLVIAAVALTAAIFVLSAIESGNWFDHGVTDVVLHTEVTQPIRLTIPKINIDTHIEAVGVTASGAMDAPTGPIHVGWYKFGTRPGDIGSAVIDGHSGWKDGIPAVFDKLATLEKGDKVTVEDDAGAQTTFIVREMRTYDASGDASLVFNSNDGKGHLNLITCEGYWDPVTKSSSKRLVVFTDEQL